ncbi:metal-dependent hydrolase [Rheinheimera sp. UJ51]|uniref:metal-dependent hydrolase n=1 Tax=Rheinheimera sp. UJ51 TaxID=2892446 RepID=UPI001E343BD6|nr:metal-dependent hydrolase [Rheinheimera sp. UJ51]MCC5452667.1 metal-dependent hydrolase [Rheinheimera sp. UJ51]
MDSLSQIALGSAVAVAVVGKHTSIKKAALWGAIAGTLPDLDVLIDYGDDLSNMVQHRGFSHSLFYLTLFSPLLALLVCRIHNEMAHYKHWLLGLWLVLITHPLLDTMTIYGTQLALPFSDYPYGVGSIFIIDPLYTLPLLLGVIWVLLKGKTLLAANTAGLVFSSCYLLWSVAAQQHVTGVVKSQLTEVYDHSTKLLVQPTALNTLLWRVLIRTDEAYYEGFYSLLEKEATIELVRFEQDPRLLEQYALHPDVQKLASFSHGFYALEQQQQQIVLTDLRMGQQQNYAFSFVVAEQAAETSLRLPRKLELSATLNWIWLTLKGEAPTELSQSPHNQTSPAAVLD